MEEKLRKLKDILRQMKSVVVAYSGGVDSSFLLQVAKDTLKENVLAVTAVSLTYPARELEEAKKIAKMLRVKHILIETGELENPQFASNSPERCYFCKNELFSKLKKLAKENNIEQVIDGSNADDVKDLRPGMRAAKELGIRSPLQEAKLTKKEIRTLSKKSGLVTWNKPSFACLSSRFPYGTKINKEDLARVSKAEDFLKNLGILQVRVRHYNDTVRIETLPEDMPKFFESKIRQRILREFKKLGYTYITVDLEGYRTGSMNEVLKIK
ncbi:ATP-dependent sacrificial sulfur transferase LarE [Candidatus Aerophobetes bacterium]|nr:ATP-dependent sacrificial sulfur transferase LarE [Candidatus Aerophobetes bacterium]